MSRIQNPLPQLISSGKLVTSHIVTNDFVSVGGGFFGTTGEGAEAAVGSFFNASNPGM